MVFSSIPTYLDASNWQQQSNSQNIVSSSFNSQLLSPAPAPPPPSQPHGGLGGGGGVGSSGSIRPGSMSDRARMANIPMPEGPLKCPRCDSSNTKFCYFNNYSLTQPRHFCKTCRRYWTRGGALRNVPVGGGCRRNKRSKGSSSKSGSTSSNSDLQTSSGSSISTMSSLSCSTAELLGLTHPQVPQLRFMSPLHSLTDFGAGQVGLNYGGIPAHLGAATSELNFQLGNAFTTSGSASSLLSSVGGLQPPPQFPFLGGLDSSPGLYSLDGNCEQPGYGGCQIRGKWPASGVITQLASVKMEDNQGMNLSRQFLGVTGNEQYWSGGGTTSAWTDLSSTSNPQ